jgi:hypothetical protein
MLQRVSSRPEQCAKAPRIAEPEAGVIIKNNINMIMFARVYCSGNDAQPAGHAEVNNHAAAMTAKDEIFGPALNRADNLPAQHPGEISWYGPAQFWSAHYHPVNAFAHNQGL